ncbi:MAG: TetR/AcrR family transcriptional regulator [Desulfobacteraceae bacterium]|nr:TetR/AcrR family transcriptional regulator [Desulfobacteraceae bacterium]
MKDTKTKILDVAEDLIQRVGLNAMSYKHISDAVGIRKASIHHHFPQKKNMVDALLSRCETTYGAHYRTIVDDNCSAPDKLRQIAGIFADGVTREKLCLVGMVSSDMNTLEPASCGILEKTLEGTVAIFSQAFRQGREEGSLTFKGTDEEIAHAFFSFLVGAQIAARVKGGAGAFNTATEIIITSWET